MFGVKRIFFTAAMLSLVLFLCDVSTSFAAQKPENPARQLQNIFVGVARDLKQSVVNIRVERSEPKPAIRWHSPQDESQGGGLEDLFRHFFRGMPDGGFRRQNPPRGFRTEAAGSGVIIDASGVILTNNHVIRDATTITAKLHDGTELPAEVVGQDAHTDIAVIKISSKQKLVPAEFGDSDLVEAGQWAIAVGNPLGLEQTVTVGVVGAVGRSGIGASAIEDFIQTDASINPGNSGGPLVNIDGKVIGINTLIFTAPGSGIGFAIPSNMARRVASQIREHGRAVRPFIGISMQQVTPDLAEHYGLENRNGAVVIDLLKDGPAAKAGLRQMDIITSINGTEMKSTNDVQKFVLGLEIGSSARVEVLRNGERKNFDVNLERMPDTYGLGRADGRSGSGRTEEGEAQNRLGFKFRMLTPEVAKELKIEGKSGLVVTDVEPDSPATIGGLMVHDLITQVNGDFVDSEVSLKEALKKARQGKSSVFVVQRASSPLFLIINHGEL